MIDYTLQIDLSGGRNPNGFFDIEVIQLGEMKSTLVDNNIRVERSGFGEIEVRNLPYKYQKLGGDKYKLYDIIQSISPDQEIWLKFTSDYETLYAYFGIIDSKIDDDEKIITITPYILDQYTDLLENRDTEVKVFDETNQIVNGDFREWTGNYPKAWIQNTQKYLDLTKEYKDDLFLGISDRDYQNEQQITFKGVWNPSTNTPNLDNIVNPSNGDYYEASGVGNYTNQYGEWYYSAGRTISYNSTYGAWMPVTTTFQQGIFGGKIFPVFPEEPIQLWQVLENVIKDKQASFSLIYRLTGTTLRDKKLAIDITLTDSVTSDVYRLLKNGEWTKELSGTDKIFYERKSIPVSIDQVSTSNMYKFSLFISNIPVSGQIQITIYRPFDYDNTNTWDENYKLLITDIIFSVSSIELKTVKIQLSGDYLVTEGEDSKAITWKNRKPKANFYSTKIHYETTLDSFFDGNGVPINNNLIMSDDNRVQIRDIIQFFQEQSSPSYKFELSKITIFRCEYIATKKRRFRAICEFSREERYYEKVNDGNGGYLPPETDAGWYNTFITEPSNLNRYLWIRTPFNMPTDQLPWLKSNIDTSPNGKLRKYKGTFDYYDSITSEKQYPIVEEKSTEISNAIDFREIIRKVYTETHISLRGKNVYSNFLWNDPLSVQETADVYLNNDTSTNYVTASDQPNDLEPQNELNKILAIHTYEFSTEPTTDKDKTVLKTTFKDLMNDFLVHFPQCYWFVDTDKNLHIEHVKYYDRINKAKDLTVAAYSYIKKYQKWEYIKDQLFSLEKYLFKNSGNIDFVSAEVTFDKIVSNKRGQDTKNEISSNIISTDLAFCLENRNSLDNGIVLVCYDTIDGENIVRTGIGQNTGKSIINGDLSISSLLTKYATYEGTWKTGQINGKGFWNNQDGIFGYHATKHIRQGEEITIKGVLLDKIIFTNLGLGIVAQRNIDYENETTKIVAMYRYSDPFPIYGSGQDNPII